MKTTLNKIRAKSPCQSGWAQLLKYLGKTQADDAPLPIKTILKSSGRADALWCLRTVEGRDKEIRLYAVWCARQVQHLMTDPRSLAALEVAEQFASGLVTPDELGAAANAAYAAVNAAYAAADTADTADAADAAANAAYAAAYAADTAYVAAYVADAAAYAAYAAAYAAYAADTADTADAAANAAAYAAYAEQVNRLALLCDEGDSDGAK
jgi:hypothetical protein